MSSQTEGRNWEYSVIKYLHYLWSGTVLFESGFRLVVNVYLETLGQPQKNFKKKKYNWCAKRGEENGIT